MILCYESALPYNFASYPIHILIIFPSIVKSVVSRDFVESVPTIIFEDSAFSL